MEYSDYLKKIHSNYKNNEFVNDLNATMFFETQFELKWIATKLKQFSFVSFQDDISFDDIKIYSAKCCNYSLKMYKGLPRGIQNGIVSFNVLAGKKISKEAIDFVLSRPPKHFAAFEMPVIVDLEKQKSYYYTDTPLWGMIYYKHFREYIEKNLDIH